MIERPIHKNRNTSNGLPDPKSGAKQSPNNADKIQIATDVFLRPNFSARIAETGMKAAKQSVAINCNSRKSPRAYPSFVVPQLSAKTVVR